MRIQVRRGTAAQFAAAQTAAGAVALLASGEPAYETDTHTWRVGDGSSLYGSLPWYVSSASYSASAAIVPGANVAAGTPAAAARTEPGNVTRMEGRLIAGAVISPGTVIGTLPAGMWPAAVVVVAGVYVAGTLAALTVGVDGTLKLSATFSNAGPDVLSLDGVTFRRS